MTQAKATARPWKVVIDDTGDPVTSGYPSISPVDESLDETIIHWDGFHHEFWHSHPSQPVQVANAYLIVTAVNERDALFRETAQLRRTLGLLVNRIEKMMENGPECDCPVEGHLCGWPTLQREVEGARVILAAKER
jgi:hypothetical protein